MGGVLTRRAAQTRLRRAANAALVIQQTLHDAQMAEVRVRMGVGVHARGSVCVYTHVFACRLFCVRSTYVPGAECVFVCVRAGVYVRARMHLRV